MYIKKKTSLRQSLGYNQKDRHSKLKCWRSIKNTYVNGKKNEVNAAESLKIVKRLLRKWGL